ncbi:hypothetical protein E2C01_050617 [Portunus trituberculatus]|uniref:Uncharacterized protein n=1 Tax=Portunus trituberculatus TaxID=210409 RepID=A0A5B7GCL0_PORTR|nr:hypothetical protein [Portunus trituberculatus]
MEMPGKDVGPPPQATEPPIGNLKLDWEEIAAQAVMQRWVSFILPTIRPVTWSVVDTKKLLDAVSLLRTGPHIPWAQCESFRCGNQMRSGSISTCVPAW